MTFVRDWAIASVFGMLLFSVAVPDIFGTAAAKAVKEYNTEMAKP
jgi:hypothetical protein